MIHLLLWRGLLAIALGLLVAPVALWGCIASSAPPEDTVSVDEPLTGTGLTGVVSLAATINANATTATLSQALPSALKNRAWLAFDPYTTTCEVVKITDNSGTTITFSPAVAQQHIGGDAGTTYIALLETPEVTPQLFGATGNGTGTNDRAAIQAAADSPVGTVLLPRGQYVVDSTITVTKAKVFKGVGTRGAGLNADWPASYGAVIDHNFLPAANDCAHALFYVTGDSSDTAKGTGGGFENLTIRQAYGDSGSNSSAGIAICYYATSTSFWSSWNYIRNVNFETVNDSTADASHAPAYQWTWAIEVNGSNVSTGEGQRDTWIENVRVDDTNSGATGGIHLDGAIGTHILNTLLNGSKGILKIDGDTTKSISRLIRLSGVTAQKLDIYDADQVTDRAGIYTDLSTQTGSTHLDLQPSYLANAPTWSAQNSVLSVGVLASLGEPAMWAGNGAQMNVPNLTFNNGTEVAFGTIDSHALNLLAGNAQVAQVLTSGDFKIVDGKLELNQGGAKPAIGQNQLQTGVACGSCAVPCVTVSTQAVTASSRIMLTTNVPAGTVGTPYVCTRTAGTSFTIRSTSGSDTSAVAWVLVEPG